MPPQARSGVALRVSPGWGEHAENGPEAELLYAAVWGDTDAVKALLAEAPRLGVNAADAAGNTALMRAANGGYIEMVTALHISQHRFVIVFTALADVLRIAPCRTGFRRCRYNRTRWRRCLVDSCGLG